MELRWTTWLIVWIVIAAASAGLAGLLWMQEASELARAVWFTGNVLWAGWLFFGLWRWRDMLWVARVAWFVILTVAVAMVLQVALDAGWRSFATGLGGAYLMAVGFVVGLMLIRLALSPGWAVTGVARTLIDEAVRMKVAVVFIVALVLLVPMLPVMMDGEQMLKYRLQTFLMWSTMATAVLLALMTVFLSVATITNEVSKRQIFLTLTKPVGRGQYLLGKWLGVALLNLLLVSVCGGGIYVFTMMLSQQPANDPADARAVQQEVLTARHAMSPTPADPGALRREFERQLERSRQHAPHQYGQPGAPLEATPQAQRDALERRVMRQWRTLDSRERTTYVFSGLERARDLGPSVQFRLKPDAQRLEDEQRGFVYLFMVVNDRPYQQTPLHLAANTAHVLQIPTEVIEDGRLAITLYNVTLPDGRGRERGQGSVYFNPDDGLQLLYTVGSFETNLVRAMVLVWLHLCFLAALGLAAGSFLSFPSACLLSLTIYIAGAMTGYIRTSLDEYGFLPGGAEMTPIQKVFFVPQAIYGHAVHGQFNEAAKLVVRMCGEAAMALVPSLSWFDPTAHLADGLVITNDMVGQGVLWMGLIWGGVVALLGWVIFRRRELAQVTV